MRSTVLAIDDSQEVLLALQAWLSLERVDVLVASEWEKGIALATEHRPQLILLDVCMPEQSGLDICRLLKADPRTESIPVIFLTAMTDMSTKLHGFDLGASDYVTKPFHPDELRARVRNALRQERDHAALRKEARVDALTGLANRAAFDSELAAVLGSAMHRNEDASLILIDLDHFKSINDRFGHPFGDQVLAQVGAVLRESVRPSDIACRYGGEELALIVPHADLDAGIAVAERVRARIAEIPFIHEGARVPVTASFGVATRILACADEPAVPTAVRRMIAVADLALYAAKQGGRNCVRSSASVLRNAS